MSKSNWHYLDNQFSNATENNFKKADILVADHYAKLDAEKSDATILTLLNRYNLVKTIWDTRYTNWISAEAVYRGETDRFEAMLADLSGNKFSLWEAKVIPVFAKKAPDFVVIFPNGSEPFMKGTYERRIAEVEALAQRLGNYPALAALQTEVQDFADALNNSRNTQQSKEDLLSQASDLLEEQRIIICNMLYANLGILMDKFNGDTDNIARFFDLTVLRETGEEQFSGNGNVAGDTTVNIVEKTFEPATQLKLKNKGTTPLKFCLASANNEACGGGVIIPPNSEQTHPASDLGDTANKFLNVSNQGAVQGSWEVEVTP